MDGNFGTTGSFDIDDGELDGMAPQFIFVLGYELAQVESIMESVDRPIGRPVRLANRGRILAAAKEAGRECKLTMMHDDPSESWMWLEIQPR